MHNGWLATANPDDLRALANALEHHRIVAPYGEAAVTAGFAGAAAFLANLNTTPPEVLGMFLRSIAEERSAATERHARTSQLVWTGPAEDSIGLRDTRSVLLDMIGRAETSVVLTTYVLAGGADVLAGLAARLRERPSLAIEFYVDVSREVGPTHAQRAAAFLGRFRSIYWPQDLTLPEIFHLPPPETGRAVVLHAKVAVVDGRFALVTSANLTDAAQERNIEAGVLLDHAVIAQALVARFRQLRAAGVIQPLV